MPGLRSGGVSNPSGTPCVRISKYSFSSFEGVHFENTNFWGWNLKLSIPETGFKTENFRFGSHVQKSESCFLADFFCARVIAHFQTNHPKFLWNSWKTSWAWGWSISLRIILNSLERSRNLNQLLRNVTLEVLDQTKTGLGDDPWSKDFLLPMSKFWSLDFLR